MEARLAARLERLCMLTEPDLAALPARAPSPRPAHADHGPAEGGGVSLDHTEDVGLKHDDRASQEVSSSACDTTSNASKRELSPAVSMNVGDPKSGSDPLTNGQEDPKENPERRFVWRKGAESSYNLGSKPQLSALPTHPLPPAVMQLSEQAAPHEKYFTPIMALAKYPYKYCDQSSKQAIASAFFDEGKFWAREWDLYYLWDIEESRPLILVRESQVVDLLKEVNSHFKLSLKITDSQREEGLVSRFPDHPRCRPRYLGRSHTRDEYTSMTNQVPGIATRPTGEPAPPSLDAQLLEDFKSMIEEAWEVTKNKSKGSKEKKRVDRLKKQKVLVDQFKRAQRYLGLRPTVIDGGNATGPPPAIDVSLSVPFAFDHSVVFVCVDVEAYEKDHTKITEVGIATLDTRDLVELTPGKDGENWRSLIRARHFRISDYAHLVNSEYVSGCPGSFFFGQSEFVSLEDAREAVVSCFQSPFCAAPRDAHANHDNGHRDKRNLIFLGHDTLTDVKYLQNLGFDPLGLPNILEAQDSANIYRVWRREEQITKLGKILERFKIDHFGLHNAGNDAVYTVQSFLAVCVREASIRNSPEVQQVWNQQKESKIAFEQQELKKDIENQDQGWSTLEADGDGGDPVPITIKKPAAISPTRTNGTNGTSASVNVRGRGFKAPEPQVDTGDGWGGSSAW